MVLVARAWASAMVDIRISSKFVGFIVDEASEVEVRSKMRVLDWIGVCVYT